MSPEEEKKNKIPTHPMTIPQAAGKKASCMNMRCAWKADPEVACSATAG